MTQIFQEVMIWSSDVQREVARLMIYRKSGRGRCLQKKHDALGLPKNARLEPSSTLPDVGLFEMQDVPFRCIWYVGGQHGRVLHISPLLRIPGVTLDSWCIDLLHSWHYGPMSTFLTFAIRALLQTDLYRSGNSDIFWIGRRTRSWRFLHSEPSCGCTISKDGPRILIGASKVLRRGCL